MDMFGVPVKKVNAGADKLYLSKAVEFVEDSKKKYGEGRWNSSALLAIHSVISACDAVTSFHFNVRCSGDRHEDVVRLVEHIRDGEAGTKKSQILAVLSLKNRVEYEERSATPGEADTLIKQAERIVEWAKRQTER